MSNNNISIKPFSEKNNNPELENSNSDSDEYIDLSNIVNEDVEHIFQFHINFDKLILKYIGKSTYAPDIIIKENFGPNSNMFLYNCVYSQPELETLKEHKMNRHNNELNDNELNDNELNDNELNDNELNAGLFLPIIKLIIKHEIDENIKGKDDEINENDKYTISSFAIKLNENIKYGIEFMDWELYWVRNIYPDEYIKTEKIDKNINPSNIIEKLIEMSI